MKKLFLFRDVSAHHVKVSHGVFVGLPSMTGVTGLNRNFAIQLAKELSLPLSSLQPAGALLAIEGYHLHEGYKKGHKPGKAVYEAIPAAWASFTAHIALEVEATTEEAEQKLAGTDSGSVAAQLLAGMSLCKGALRNVKRPVDLSKMVKNGAGTERDYALKLLPAQSQVVVDYGHIVSSMRSTGLPLMEGLVASTLRHSKRPLRYKAFFESDEVAAQDCVLVPVMHGLLKIESTPSLQSIRPDSNGNLEASGVTSPAFTLTRLQKAASLRLRVREGNEPMYAFWREQKYAHGFFSVAE